MIGSIISVTVTLVALYLVLTHSNEFSGALGAAGQFYRDSVTTLQGR
jgi:hypothetical protein